MSSDRTGPRLAIAASCEGCEHLRFDFDVYRCAHPKASSVAEPMICSAHREPRAPAWCPELPGARLAMAREIVAGADEERLPCPLCASDDAHGYARGRAEGLEGIDRWKMIAEGKDVRIAVLRDEIARLTAELAAERHLLEELRAMLADTEASVDRWKVASERHAEDVQRLTAELAEARAQRDCIAEHRDEQVASLRGELADARGGRRE